MSCSYADGLSPYWNKGVLGLAEKFDAAAELNEKVEVLANWIKCSKHVVMHTGAGISTAAGIPDFRGPKGVWTLEQRGEKPNMNVSFDEATPTKTHMALVKLVENGYVKFVISQNIDGLHLRSGLPREFLAELHGNMFVDECRQCQRLFVSKTATTSVGQKCLGKPCPAFKCNGRPCRGKLFDTILDWEANLPENELEMAYAHASTADLSICLGSSLQIVPSGNLPLLAKKNDGRLVICNLQPTKHDRKADLIINWYVEDIAVKLAELLSLDIPEYKGDLDPTQGSHLTDWTISDVMLDKMKKKCKESKRKLEPKRKCAKKEKVETLSENDSTNSNFTEETKNVANSSLILIKNENGF